MSSNLLLRIKMRQSIIAEVFNFLEDTTRKILFETGMRRENIVILMPDYFPSFLEDYLRGLEFSEAYSYARIMKGAEVQIFGCSTHFLSPTNDVYVFYKEYSTYSTPEKVNFKFSIGT